MNEVLLTLTDGRLGQRKGQLDFVDNRLDAASGTIRARGAEARARLLEGRGSPETFDACVRLAYPRITTSHADVPDIEP